MNRIFSETNRNENWMLSRLEAETDLKWTRNAMWQKRLFDFWNDEIGVAVEVDGLEHLKKKDYDAYRDKYNFYRSGIIVLRVRNLNNQDADKAIETINNTGFWQDRRDSMGLNNKKLKRDKLFIASIKEKVKSEINNR